MENEKNSLLTTQKAKELTIDDICALEKRVLPKKVHKKYIYFLFYNDLLVYIGQTVQEPEMRVRQHLEDKFFDKYAYYQVDNSQDLNEAERTLINRFSPIYNCNAATRGEIDMYSLWNYRIVVTPRLERGKLGGFRCLKVEDSGDFVTPAGYVVGKWLKEYKHSVFFYNPHYKIVKEMYEQNKEKEITWIKSECRQMASKFLMTIDLSKVYRISDKSVECHLNHIMLYCYKRGCLPKYVPHCIDAAVAELQKTIKFNQKEIDPYPILKASFERIKKGYVVAPEKTETEYLTAFKNKLRSK